MKRLRKAGLLEFFDAIITMDMSGKAKPSPGPFLLAMKKPGVNAEETMLVGDSIRRDIVPAKARGGCSRCMRCMGTGTSMRVKERGRLCADRSTASGLWV